VTRVGRFRPGIDPIAAKRAQEEADRPLPTFRAIAADVIKAAQGRSENAKVRYQIERHLGPAFCGPLLDRPINEITTLDVVAVLEPVWHDKPEVARKLYPALRKVFDRGRIVLKDQHGVAAFPNPAAWEDIHAATRWESPKELSRGSHPALPYPHMPELIGKLRERAAVAARALEFLVLTNVRTDAVLNARKTEIALDEALWTVPLAHLKDRKHRKQPFRVPLCPRALEIAREMMALPSAYLFPGLRGKPLSNMAMLTVIRRLNRVENDRWVDPTYDPPRPVVPHGFWATFRTWAEESTGFPHAVVEEAMGHQVAKKTERSYRRTDVLDRRRELMNAWGAHCEPSLRGNVVQIRKATAAE
jgi:integrase